MQKKEKLIILVEDEKVLANLIGLKLKQAGYRVVIEEDGTKGLNSILTTKPDLVLLDVVLPGMNGFEILKKLQEVHMLPELPIIIISNSGQPIEIEDAFDLGVRDYLIKVNFDSNEVLEKVNQLFIKIEQERQTKKDNGYSCPSCQLFNGKIHFPFPGQFCG